ncbi:MAG: helix-turn-helix domain-containing protein [Caulobacter sp.]|nr:helix-turn-helix domain-containing protein [Caulobacter sp.]
MTSRPGRDTYRHGNLRGEAIAAARALIVESGHEALSLRRVADAVGVAHRSLYNHFEDREALLDAVAEEAFVALATALKAATDAGLFVAAYVGFALSNPAIFALMTSRPHGAMKKRPSLQRAVHLGLTEALRLFARPDRDSAENRRAVMKVIILLQGGLAMYADGILDLPDDEALVAELRAMVADA